MDHLTADVIQQIIPIVSVLAVFGMPVLIVGIVQYFKFRNRELEAEIEARKLLGERDRAYLEARIERIEQVLLRAPAPLKDPGLFEPPPVPLAEQGVGAKRDPKRE